MTKLIKLFTITFILAIIFPFSAYTSYFHAEQPTLWWYVYSEPLVENNLDTPSLPEKNGNGEPFTYVHLNPEDGLYAYLFLSGAHNVAPASEEIKISFDDKLFSSPFIHVSDEYWPNLQTENTGPPLEGNGGAPLGSYNQGDDIPILYVELTPANTGIGNLEITINRFYDFKTYKEINVDAKSYELRVEVSSVPLPSSIGLLLLGSLLLYLLIRQDKRVITGCFLMGVFSLLFINIAHAQDIPTYISEWGNYYHGTFYPLGITINPDKQEIFVTDPENKRILKYSCDKGRFLYKWKWSDLNNPNGDFKDPQGIAFSQEQNKLYLVDAKAHKLYIFDNNGTYLQEIGGWGTGDNQFMYPQRVAIDSSGNVYVTDYGTRTIKKFKANGEFITKWGGAGRENGQFAGMCSIAIDPMTDDVFVADWGNYRIQKFDSNGNWLLSFGEKGTENGQFGYQLEIGVNPANGYLYVVDTSQDRIQVFDKNGGYLFQWGGIGTDPGFFKSPTGITFDNNGNVYIADMDNHRIQKFDKDGNFLFEWYNKPYRPEELYHPSGIAVDQNSGVVYVTDQAKNIVKKYDENGNLLLTWGRRGTGDGEFNAPLGITVDNDGNVLVVDMFNHRIQKFDPQGNFLGKFGEYGSAEGQFNTPTDIVVDPQSGDIFVVERYNHRVQHFDANWNFINEFGGYGTNDYNLKQPYGVAIHPITHNVYVTDTERCRIKVYDQNGTFLFLWGNAPGYDPGYLAWPRNIDIDNNGYVYVADTDHNRIQKFDEQGNFISMIESDVDTGVVFHPRALAVDSKGYIYVTASYEGQIHKFTCDGDYILSWGYNSLFAKGELYGPRGIVFDPLTGNIFIVNTYKEQVQVFDLNGNYLKAIGKSGQYYEDLGMAWPQSITLDSNGNIYVGCGAHEDIEHLTTPKTFIKVFNQNGDFIRRWGGYHTANLIRGLAHLYENGNDYIYATFKRECKVRKFDTAGNVLLEFGGKGEGNNQFLSPYGIAVDPQTGDIFVSDEKLNCIKKFNSNGEFLFKWGKSGSNPGEFNSPKDIKIGPDNNLYVCDFGNNRVQVFTTNGEYLYSIKDHVISPQDITFDIDNNLYIINYYPKKIIKLTWNNVLNNTLEGDFNNDGIVNFLDYVVFSRAFNTNRESLNYNYYADFDNDGDVDFADYVIFSNNFGRTR